MVGPRAAKLFVVNRPKLLSWSWRLVSAIPIPCDLFDRLFVQIGPADQTNAGEIACIISVTKSVEEVGDFAVQSGGKRQERLRWNPFQPRFPARQDHG